MPDLANPVHLGASCSQAHLKARECTVLANTLHKAARLQKLWLSKMLDQGLRQQSRQDAQITQIRGRRFGGNSGKHDSSPLSLLSWSRCSWQSLAPPQNCKAVSQTLDKNRTKWWSKWWSDEVNFATRGPHRAGGLLPQHDGQWPSKRSEMAVGLNRVNSSEVWRLPPSSFRITPSLNISNHFILCYRHLGLFSRLDSLTSLVYLPTCQKKPVKVLQWLGLLYPVPGQQRSRTWEASDSGSSSANSSWFKTSPWCLTEVRIVSEYKRRQKFIGVSMLIVHDSLFNKSSCFPHSIRVYQHMCKTMQNHAKQRPAPVARTWCQPQTLADRTAASFQRLPARIPNRPRKCPEVMGNTPRDDKSGFQQCLGAPFKAILWQNKFPQLACVHPLQKRKPNKWIKMVDEAESTKTTGSIDSSDSTERKSFCRSAPNRFGSLCL